MCFYIDLHDMGFATQWKGINGYLIRDPGTFLTEYDESHGIGYPIAFMLVSFVVVMLPLALLSTAANITAPSEAAIGLAVFLVFGVVFWILGMVEALIAHGIASLFGADEIATTFEAYAFPTIIRYGLWWIPIVNLIGLYGFYLQIKGIAAFHGISTGKAAIAGVVAAFLSTPTIFVLVTILAAFVFDLGTTTGAQPAMVLFESLG